MNRCTPFFTLLFFMAVHAFADIYSWTDKNGVKHFSNNPPPKGEKVTGLIVMEESAAEETKADTTKPPGDDQRENPAESADREVYIYVDPQSDECVQALAFLDRNKIPYTKFDVTASDDERQRFKNVQGTGVPLIFIGNRRMDGWNEDVASEYLGMKKPSTLNEKAARAIDIAKKK
jgi:glutaredoxin